MGDDLRKSRGRPQSFPSATLSALDFYVLLALALGRLTPEEIHVDVVTTSRRIVDPSKAELARTLSRLSRRGWIGTEYSRGSFLRIGVRRNFHLTSLGRGVATAEAHSINELLATNPTIAALLQHYRLRGEHATPSPSRLQEHPG